MFHYYIGYTTLNPSIIGCLSSGDMYLFLGVALSTSTPVSLFCNSLVDFFEKFVILSAILLLIKLPVASTVFLIALLDAVFVESVADFLALSRVFDRIYCLNFYSFFAYFWFNWISHIYKLHLITIVKFMLPSISNGWLFWSVNHTLLFGYSELNVFKNIWFVGEISSRLPNGLFGKNVYKTLESCWQSLLTMFQCYYVCNFKMWHIFIIFVFSFYFQCSQVIQLPLTLKVQGYIHL